VKIEGPVWYTIYHHLPVVKGVNKPITAGLLWKMRILFFAGAGTEFVNIPKSSGNWSFLKASNDVSLWQRLR